MEYFRVSNMELEGPIGGSSGSFLSSWNNLLELSLSGNRLRGNIPDSLSNSNHPLLQDLDLSDNQFTGQVPSTLASFGGLLSLNLGSNNLNGLIPSALGNLGTLSTCLSVWVV
jgi:hypothetical protein